jgi:molybdopterin molybdotransferase
MRWESIFGFGAMSLESSQLAAQDSSLMAPLAKADCLLIREPHAPAASSGSRCVILKLAL